MAVAELVKEYSLDEALETLHKNGKVLSKYQNFIGGKWVPPVKGKYFVDHSPINGEPIAEIANQLRKMSKQRSMPLMPPRRPGHIPLRQPARPF